MALGFEQGHLQALGLVVERFGWGFIFAACLKRLEDFARAAQHGVGDAREFGDLDTVAFVGAARHDLAQPDDMIALFFDGDAEVLSSRQRLFQFVQMMVVCGEERLGAHGVEVFGDGPGERQTVVGAGAAPDFI